jgi:hypothetical protein
LGLEKNTVHESGLFSLPQSCKERIMFSFFSVHRARRFLSVGFILLAMTAIMTGCNTDPEPDLVPGPSGTSLPDGLLGKWATSVDSFLITRSSGIETVEYDDGGYGYGYKGTVRFVSQFDNSTGVIIIQLTEFSPSQERSKPYHAIYYLDFKPGDSISLNNTSILSVAYDPDKPTANNADTATLEEAKEKFTRDRIFEYVNSDYLQVYKKQ